MSIVVPSKWAIGLPALPPPNAGVAREGAVVLESGCPFPLSQRCARPQIALMLAGAVLPMMGDVGHVHVHRTYRT